MDARHLRCSLHGFPPPNYIVRRDDQRNWQSFGGIIKHKCPRRKRIFVRSVQDVLGRSEACAISGSACGAAYERRCGRVAAGDDAATPSDRGCLARVAPIGRLRRERRHRPIGCPAAWIWHLPGDDRRALDGRAGTICCPHIELVPGTPAVPAGPVLSQTEPWQSDLVTLSSMPLSDCPSPGCDAGLTE